MKYSSFFYAIVLLLISPFAALASDITLKDISTSTSKNISVEIDTGTEMTDNIKVSIETSSDVTISNIEEADISCSTFSSPQNNNMIELMCTLPEEKVVKGALAKISFTTTETDYKFTVQKDSSQIGKLAIENIVDVGSKTSEQITPPTTITPTTTKTVQTQTTVKQGKPTGFSLYLPYILLGAAGIFLVSMIVLLVTKKKEPVVLADVPASTTTTVTTTNTEVTPPVEPTTTEVDLNNIPDNLQNATQEDNLIPTPKPTLQEIVNQPVEANPAEITTPPPSNEQQDLQELLSKENPTEVIPSQTVQETLPPQENPASPVIVDNYVADTNQGLPNIGFVSPEDSANTTTETVMEIPQMTEPSPTPVQNLSQPIPPQNPTSPLDTDLQQMANQEISTMQTITTQQPTEAPLPETPPQPEQPQF